jgi:hypothetical protein
MHIAWCVASFGLRLALLLLDALDFALYLCR